MITVELSKGFVARISDEDAPLAEKNWYYRGGYAVRTLTTGDEYLHRAVAIRMGLDIEGLQVDHIDPKDPLTRLNNQRSNLRAATIAENQRNRRPQPNVTGYKGVCRSGERFIAQIKYEGVSIRLGAYATAEEAAAAYDAMAKELFGEFACLNGVTTAFVDSRGKNVTNTSGYRGVSYSTKGRKWTASIKVKGHKNHLGSFVTKEEAARAYNEAAIKFLGSKAKLNTL